MFKSTFVNPENLTQNFILTHWLNNTHFHSHHSALKKVSFIHKHFDTT